MQESFQNNWLPTTKKEVEQRGWDALDVILFSGDAYIDHPSFGAAVIGRTLEAEGLRVAIVPQPNWRDDLRDFKKLGTPRLFFGISAGCMDSMVNHYTANKRLRSNDAYTAGGVSGFRPDYTTIVYSTILKNLFPDVPVIIGGIEASMRRFTHYDYWSDQLKKSILLDSKADLLVYGMGEKSIIAIARALQQNRSVTGLQTIPQTAFVVSSDHQNVEELNAETIALFSHEACLADKHKSAQNFRIIEEESNKIKAARLTQRCNNELVVVNPPYETWTQEEIDATYDLPYTRLPHPKYKDKRIPAYDMIRFSVNTHRGCFGGCSFCTISMHQGKQVLSRSEKSIFKEIEQLGKLPEFKGILTDLGGPSANMYGLRGIDQSICEACKRPSCIFPAICRNLDRNHSRMIRLYKAVDQLPYIKKAFIGSGIRYDLLLQPSGNSEVDKSLTEYTKEVIQHHVSGRLKVAPEHTSPQVLKLMRKPSFELFKQFQQKFEQYNRDANLKQQLIPYFISSHPGCSNMDMAELAVITKSLHFKLEQVQDFTPTPMTLSTEMYYSGINPYTGESVETPKQASDKISQQRFFFWYKPEYRQSILHDLRKMNRNDLIDKLLDYHYTGKNDIGRSSSTHKKQVVKRRK
ncbi:YgiQ family radical SAM protein [Microbacter margulisiae]|uniref:Putative radical SAM protein YgiQ n=1 Tax=Microbacter margulisiae TaxID=1350067 RepID=A0A7W5DRG0_9PORP|nr:YgiQ family radical SAM protein [Microbacter margulisiae]MBB3187739.1 putative radical SAM protein YgiQ [Microbacter margulisiae]